MFEYTRLFYRKREGQATFCSIKSIFKVSLVESIVAAHLMQRFGRDVFYWKPDHEVNLLVFREGRPLQLIEVKYADVCS